MAASMLTPGDIAIIGYVNNGNATNPDAFSFVTFAPIGSGTQIYFTDNGFATGSGFRGVTATDTAGNEPPTRFTANVDFAAGTIFRSNENNIASTATPSGSFNFINSGRINPAITGSYGAPAYGQGTTASTSGDQIAAVQASDSTNPFLLNNYNPIYQIDYTGAFEDATTSQTGNVIPGLSQSADTAVLFGNPTGATNGYSAFNRNTLSSGTKADWLAAIDNSANWTFNSTNTSADLPTSATAALNVNAVPEPITMFGSLTALVVGAGLKQFRKRFQA